MRRFFDEAGTRRREAEADGARFGMLVFPFRFQVEPGAPEPAVQQEIAAFCRSESVSCLDLLPTLRRVGPSAFVDYDHLSRSGASLAADTILTSGLLPDGYADQEVLRKRFGQRTLALRDFVSALGDPDAEVRAAAAWTIGAATGGREPPGAEASLPRLAEALRDEHEAGRAAAARAPGALGPKANATTPALRAALDDPP